MMFPYSVNMATLFSLAKFLWFVVTVLTGFHCIKEKNGYIKKIFRIHSSCKISLQKKSSLALVKWNYM